MAMTSLVSSGLRAGVRWSLTPGGQALQPTVAIDPTATATVAPTDSTLVSSDAENGLIAGVRWSLAPGGPAVKYLVVRVYNLLLLLILL